MGTNWDGFDVFVVALLGIIANGIWCFHTGYSDGQLDMYKEGKVRYEQYEKKTRPEDSDGTSTKDKDHG